MEENDEGSVPPADDRDEDRRQRRRETAATWWRRVRPGLLLVEIVAGARQNVALAGAARAIVLLGDAVFAANDQPRPPGGEAAR